MIAVTFNSVRLDSLTDVNIIDRKVHPIPIRIAESLKLAEYDGELLTNAYFKGRKINISGYIDSASRNDAETARDTLLKNLTGTNKTLLFEQAGTDRKYTATMENVMFSDSKGGHIEFDIMFNCADPFGYGANQLQTINSAVTSSPTNTSVTNNGSYKLYPIIRINLTSFTGTGQQNIHLYTSGSGITVFRAWTAGEALTIDGVNKMVKIGSTDITYSGIFPSLEPGTNNVTYEDSFTARNVNITVLYTYRYL